MLPPRAAEGLGRPEGKDLWLQLFLTFFKIGAFSLGGGFAAISLTYHEVVERRRWLDGETFLAGTSLAQGAPGANAVNTAVFVGYRLAGLQGAVTAVTACILPSLVMVLGLGLILLKTTTRPALLDRVFEGLRAGILGLLAYLLLSWLWPLRRDLRGVLLFGLMLVALLVLKWHPILVMACGGVLGFISGPGRGDGNESR